MKQETYFTFASISTGPSLPAHGDIGAWAQAVGTFLEAAMAPQHRRLADWWQGRIAEEGAVPAYDNRWHTDLADTAVHLYSRERLPGGKVIRYRYAGEVPVQRVGVEMSGRFARELFNATDQDIWKYNRLLMEEIRPVFISLDYRLVGRGFVKGDMLEVPLRDPTTGEARFVLGAAYYRDTA